MMKTSAEEKIKNPDSAIKRLLERDFHAEISLRLRGGDPEMQSRFGEPQYGLKIKNRNRRKVPMPKLRRDGDREWFESGEAEILDRISNEEAYHEWTAYMEKGLDINPDWTFDKLFEEIQKFFRNAPDLERYGKPYTVYADSGELYQPVVAGKEI